MPPKLYSALKWGALLGGPLAIFETWLAISLLSTQNASDVDVTWFLSILLESLIPLIAGLLAARETGEARSGLIAGLTAGCIVALVNIVSEAVLPAPLIAQSPDQPAPSTVELVITWIEFRAITIGLGAWFGFLGGRMTTLAPRRPPR